MKKLNYQVYQGTPEEIRAVNPFDKNNIVVEGGSFIDGYIVNPESVTIGDNDELEKIEVLGTIKAVIGEDLDIEDFENFSLSITFQLNDESEETVTTNVVEVANALIELEYPDGRIGQAWDNNDPVAEQIIANIENGNIVLSGISVTQTIDVFSFSITEEYQKKIVEKLAPEYTGRISQISLFEEGYGTLTKFETVKVTR